MANTSTDILAAIDAGSSKVLCVIARPSDTLEGCFKVLGFGRVPSQGIKNGIIYDVEKAVFPSARPCRRPRTRRASR